MKKRKITINEGEQVKVAFIRNKGKKNQNKQSIILRNNMTGFNVHLCSAAVKVLNATAGQKEKMLLEGKPTPPLYITQIGVKAEARKLKKEAAK